MTLGYATAAMLAAVAGVFGYNLVACIGIFWVGGAILAVSLFTVRLTFLAHRQKQAPVESNVVLLHSAAGRPTLVTQQGMSALRRHIGDRST